MAPGFITRLSGALECVPVSGVNHWRFRCPLCQREPGGVPRLVVWKRQSGTGYAYTCYGGLPDCTVVALRNEFVRLGVMTREEVNAGMPLPKFRPDDAVVSMLKAQAFWRASEPVEPDDPVGKWLDRQGLDARKAPKSLHRLPCADRPYEWLAVEALIDPYQYEIGNAPVLGVAVTHLHEDGRPVYVRDIPKRRTIGRKRGTGTPVGDHKAPFATAMVNVAVGVAPTLAMEKLDFGRIGWSVGSADALPALFLPPIYSRAEIGVANTSKCFTRGVEFGKLLRAADMAAHVRSFGKRDSGFDASTIWKLRSREQEMETA